MKSGGSVDPKLIFIASAFPTNNIYTYGKALTPPGSLNKKSLNNGMAMMRKVKKPVPKFYASVYIEGLLIHFSFFSSPNQFHFSNFLGFI